MTIMSCGPLYFSEETPISTDLTRPGSVESLNLTLLPIEPKRNLVNIEELTVPDGLTGDDWSKS